MYDRRKRKRNPYFLKIGDVLQKTLEKRQIALPMKDVRTWEAWTQSVGPLISAQTSIDRLKKDILFIKVSNSVWMQQLQFMKRDIISKINTFLGREAVKNIFFSIGHIPAPSSEKESPAPFLQTKPLTKKEMQKIESCTSVIKDPELNNILKRVMTKDLQRRRTGS